jgi:hypothetical protein
MALIHPQDWLSDNNQTGFERESDPQDIKLILNNLFKASQSLTKVIDRESKRLVICKCLLTLKSRQVESQNSKGRI